MKTVIAGSREITDYKLLCDAVAASNFPISEVISGGARGVDTLGERYAKEHNIPLNRVLPDWQKFGKSAGYKRNVEMAKVADAAIILWDGESRGTKHMINIAQEYKLKVHLVTV